MTSRLEWAPIRHYTSIADLDKELDFKKKVNRAGIYIWGFKDDNGLFWPYYVGKHRNVPFRLCEHASYLKGGCYTLYSPYDLFTSSDKKSYEPHYIGRRIELIAGRAPELQSDLDNMLSRFHYTFLLIENFTKIGDELEYAVINSLKRDMLCNVRGRMPKEPMDLGNLHDVIHPDFLTMN